MDNTSHYDNTRKAAILLASLDPRTSAGLVAQLDPAQAQQLLRQAEQLGPIDPEEQQAVIDEFMQIGPFGAGRGVVPTRETIEDDVELSSEISSRLAAVDEQPMTPSATPFNLASSVDTADLAAKMQNEPPQVIAVIIAHLSPKRAADVLAHLDQALQSDVIRRLTTLSETEPQLLSEIEDVLRDWIDEVAGERSEKEAGISTVQAILGAADRGMKHSLLSNIAKDDRQLAHQLGHRFSATRANPPSIVPAPQPVRPTPPPAFEQLANLDDASLHTLLTLAAPELTVLALTGCNDKTIQEVLRHLPPDQLTAVRYALDHPGPTRLSDVEQARHEMAVLAARLHDEGKIRLTTRRISVAA
jgi:flagellar motor switch protein FliG